MHEEHDTLWCLLWSSMNHINVTVLGMYAATRTLRELGHLNSNTIKNHNDQKDQVYLSKQNKLSCSYFVCHFWWIAIGHTWLERFNRFCVTASPTKSTSFVIRTLAGQPLSTPSKVYPSSSCSPSNAHETCNCFSKIISTHCLKFKQRKWQIVCE